MGRAPSSPPHSRQPHLERTVDRPRAKCFRVWWRHNQGEGLGRGSHIWPPKIEFISGNLPSSYGFEAMLSPWLDTRNVRTFKKTCSLINFVSFINKLTCKMLQKQTENSSILNFPKSLYIFLNQETNIVTILQILFKFWHYLLIRFSFFPGVGFNPRSHTAFMNFQNTNIWAPVPEILIYLGHGLGIWILKSSRGDSSIHPSL